MDTPAACDPAAHDPGRPAAADAAALARHLLPALESLAAEAGRQIMQIYAGGVTAQRKQDGSPVTAADLAAEAIILAGLARLAPGVAVVSEEAGGARPSPAPEALFLLVDPLDGTQDFLDGTGEFTVNIALVSAGRPVGGVVHAPALGRIWSGVAGQGASAQAIAPDGRPVAGSRRAIGVRPRPDAGLIAVVSRSHPDPATLAWLAGQAVASQRAIGSSLKFCLLAEGAADVYPRLSPTMEWDTAAGHAVLEAAGGRVTDEAGGWFRYGKRAAAYRNGSFLAWGGAPGATPS